MSAVEPTVPLPHRGREQGRAPSGEMGVWGQAEIEQQLALVPIISSPEISSRQSDIFEKLIISHKSKAPLKQAKGLGCADYSPSTSEVVGTESI